MNSALGRILKRSSLLGILLVAAGLGWYVRSVVPVSTAAAKAEEHAHDHAQGPVDTLELTPQALGNIGLQTTKAKIDSVDRQIAIPAMIVQQPGRTTTRVVAPLTGVVTKVFALTGEILEPGRPLFEVRMTHEDLVQAQVEFLKTLEERQVVQREVARLKPLVEKGLSLQTLLEREYELDKLNAQHKAQKQALLLHGLSATQIEEIITSRHLMSTLTVVVPSLESAPQPAVTVQQVSAVTSSPPPENARLVDELKVQQGQLVNAGDTLCTLADLSNLYIEGRGFEQDSARILKAVRNDWKVTGVLEIPGQEETRLEYLSILYVADKVDSESRTFAFYLHLKNEVLRDSTVGATAFSTGGSGQGSGCSSAFRSSWEKRLVVPASAVVQDGVEMYVFVQRNEEFKRKAVHMLYRDRYNAVIQTDGALFPGELVVSNGAAQLLMALKAKAAGPATPHACGHVH